MAGLVKIGDLCTGHGDFPPRECIEGSSNIFMNGKAISCEGDRWAVHCDSDDNCHSGVALKGSSNVFMNGKTVSRVGDWISCGSKIADNGTKNVFG